MRSNPQPSELKFDARQIACQEVDHQRPSDVTTAVLWVVIPYTTPELTRAALRHAGVCTDLHVHVSLLDIQVIPFPRPLDQPPIDKDSSKQRLRDVFGQSGLPGRTDVLYARDGLEECRRVLEPRSLVILAAKNAGGERGKTGSRARY